MPELDLSALVAIFAALSLGGLMKGATGMGTPVVAVPVMAAFVDVKLAVVVMVIPNLATNLWQIRQHGQHRLGEGFATRFALGGAIGALLGTWLLVALPVRSLSLTMAAAVILYIVLRLARPDFRLDIAAARRVVLPASTAAGVLQGAAGISAPIAVSFLNALRLDRLVFIATISIFFATMSLVQIPALLWVGLLTPQVLLLAALALIPIFAAMPVGAWLARHLSAAQFDRAILVLLTLLALRLIWSAI
ncbi:MAG: sulfite exporter TauE/SafE family protein [Rhodobacter sp.]|nr:sulfite exporter TauE/SafE family protein [Rhodobacter sp.]